MQHARLFTHTTERSGYTDNVVSGNINRADAVFSNWARRIEIKVVADKGVPYGLSYEIWYGETQPDLGPGRGGTHKMKRIAKFRNSEQINKDGHVMESQ